MYKIQGSNITNTITKEVFPHDAGNRHYQEYLEWLEDGNEPEPEFTLEQRRSLAKGRVKNEAAQHITNVVPAYKQLNILSRALELVLKKVDNTITTNETTELAAIQSNWDVIRTIRENSNTLEALIETSNDPESITLEV